jgi:hypothetical protein
MQEIIHAAFVHSKMAFSQRVSQGAMHLKQQGVRLSNCGARVLGQQSSCREKHVQLAGY